MNQKSRTARRAGLAPSAYTRRGEIHRLMRKLEWDGYPRLQMFFIVVLTGAVGMATSYVLLQAGLQSMPARYPVSVGCAYVAFLLLLWFWLNTKASDYLDAPIDLPIPGGGQGAPSGAGYDPVFSGGGGQSGGGGASGSFDVNEALPSPSLPNFNGPGGDSVGETVGEVVGGADEGAIPLAIVLLIAALAAVLLFSTLYVVYLAPALFAELIVDGLLAASLYRRLRGLQTRHWLESAVRRTVFPFIVTALCLSAAGFALQAYTPGAITLGEAFRLHEMSK